MTRTQFLPIIYFFLFGLAAPQSVISQEFSNPACQIPNDAEISAANINFEQSSGEIHFEGDVVIVRDGYCLITNSVKVLPLPEDPSIMETINLLDPLELYISKEDEFQIVANQGTYNRTNDTINLIGDVKITQLNTNNISMANEGNYLGETRNIELKGGVSFENNSDGKSVFVQSETSLIIPEDDRVEFEGDVFLSASDYEIEARSQRGTYHSDNRIVVLEANVKVEHQTPSGVGTITSNSAELSIVDNEIIFEGNVSLKHPEYPQVEGRDQITYLLDN